MNYRWIGAAMIIAACGGTGLSMAMADKREEQLLHQLSAALAYMASELEFRVTPLPQLCRQTGSCSFGAIQKLFYVLATELEGQTFPLASDCMRTALNQMKDLPASVRSVCRELGNTLGQLDLTGQLQGLSRVEDLCNHRCKRMEHNREQRLRSYRTLSLCAGTALAILLL